MVVRTLTTKNMKQTKPSPAVKVLGAAMLLSPLLSTESHGQDPQPAAASTIAARLTKYEVAPALTPQFRTVLSDYVLHSMETESNVISEAYYEKGQPSVLWLMERWATDEKLAKSRLHSSFKAITSLSKTALMKASAAFNLTDLEPLTKEQWRRAAATVDSPIVVMLFVESRPGTEAAFEEIYHTAMPAFRGEAGVINYQLSRFQTDKTKFLTYEKFRNKEAFDFHLDFPPIQPVIDYLNTSIREQPFQKGLHILVPFAHLVDK